MVYRPPWKLGQRSDKTGSPLTLISPDGGEVFLVGDAVELVSHRRPRCFPHLPVPLGQPTCRESPYGLSVSAFLRASLGPSDDRHG